MLDYLPPVQWRAEPLPDPRLVEGEQLIWTLVAEHLHTDQTLDVALSIPADLEGPAGALQLTPAQPRLDIPLRAVAGDGPEDEENVTVQARVADQVDGRELPELSTALLILRNEYVLSLSIPVLQARPQDPLFRSVEFTVETVLNAPLPAADAVLELELAREGVRVRDLPGMIPAGDRSLSQALILTESGAYTLRLTTATFSDGKGRIALPDAPLPFNIVSSEIGLALSLSEEEVGEGQRTTLTVQVWSLPLGRDYEAEIFVTSPPAINITPVSPVPQPVRESTATLEFTVIVEMDDRAEPRQPLSLAVDVRSQADDRLLARGGRLMVVPRNGYEIAGLELPSGIHTAQTFALRLSLNADTPLSATATIVLAVSRVMGTDPSPVFPQTLTLSVSPGARTATLQVAAGDFGTPGTYRLALQRAFFAEEVSFGADQRDIPAAPGVFPRQLEVQWADPLLTVMPVQFELREGESTTLAVTISNLGDRKSVV